MKRITHTPLQFSNGSRIKNRLMLAPLTNTQSHEDGILSEDELNWLTMRAKGGFGMVMTCASHVQEIGKGFPGQLGIFSDHHCAGHKKLVEQIQAHDCLIVIQLHHAGMRAPVELINQKPVSASNNEKYGARELSLDEIEELKKDFISAALRAQACGYDGVEIHGAHGYIITQFLSAEYNQRNDQYGGSLENRARLLFEIIDGIRRECGNDFLMGVRLSPERYGMDIEEIKKVCQRLIDENKINFIDLSLWDIFKFPEDENYKEKLLLEYFTALDFKEVRFTAAGNIRNGKDVLKAMELGLDFVTIGRAGILHHNFPKKIYDNPLFQSIKTPVKESHLRKEGLGDDFITYMRKWKDFVIKD